jgi:phosphonate transport system ATP-binding protein
LSCLNRLIDPTSGEILFKKSFLTGNDSDTQTMDICKLSGSDLSLLRRKIGMVFQQFNIVKRLTVIDNVLSGSLGYQGTLEELLEFFL